MSDPGQRFDVDASAVVPIVTTEHFALQSTRAATTSESVGRAGMFLSTVSTALVAMAFAGQVTDFDGAFIAFAVITFLSLLFLGLVTFERVVQASIEDIAAAQRMNRLRRLYLELAPGLAGYLQPPAESDQASAVLRAGGLRPGQWQLLLTVAGMISIINSVIVGVLVGVGAGLLVSDPIWPAATLGVLAFVLAAIAQHRFQLRLRTSAPDPLPPLPPDAHHPPAQRDPA